MTEREFIADEGRGGGVVGAREPPRTSEGSCGSELFLVPAVTKGSLHGGSARSVNMGSDAALNAAEKVCRKRKRVDGGMDERSGRDGTAEKSPHRRKEREQGRIYERRLEKSKRVYRHHLNKEKLKADPLEDNESNNHQMRHSNHHNHICHHRPRLYNSRRKSECNVRKYNNIFS